ncbi:MAG: hypothetical protein ABIG39_02990 [Candidatus Micrarchaeota archaeon]
MGNGVEEELERCRESDGCMNGHRGTCGNSIIFEKPIYRTFWKA